ncbi:hypothetical protein HanXRQr2_Chr02g0056631 [Helianthus annuus]|uniref:Secreted protein n=1 Tax=Helianthus annuus TaxID=4232 RepID=A0A9K3NZF7_HELAN|nr:hypothetical protein HanXRQr2_Chr02g0056631 [Helianthus annuus]KAJ0951101.1 hypothetical protein HanPSC8_Chr02g0056011 [Helianthus annuus]
MKLPMLVSLLLCHSLLGSMPVDEHLVEVHVDLMLVSELCSIFDNCPSSSSDNITSIKSLTSSLSCSTSNFLFCLCSSTHPLSTKSKSLAVFFISFSYPCKPNHERNGIASDTTKIPINRKNSLIALWHLSASSPPPPPPAAKYRFPATIITTMFNIMCSNHLFSSTTTGCCEFSVHRQ